MAGSTPKNSVVFEYHVIPLTSATHKAVYPAIDPQRPELSQKGHTVLITGAASGIGYAIAGAFAAAGAEKVIVVGRAEPKLQAAVAQLQKEAVAAGHTETAFVHRVCQLSDPQSIDRLWDHLREPVDVLVLNAADIGTGSLWDQGWQAVWEQYETNVRASHQCALRFRKQKTSGKKSIVNISTSGIHDWPVVKPMPSYGLTKNGGTLLLQLLAGDVEPTELQIVSIHPGALLTPIARARGFDEASTAWDDASLPGGTAVWAASDEAAFLHGRFIWAAWDVGELSQGELRQRIDSDDKFLRVGVVGL